MTTYEDLASKDQKGTFALKVRFATSSHTLKILEGTYRECLEQAKTMIEFVKREHLQNRTGNTFQETYNPRGKCDVIFVNKITTRIGQKGQVLKSGSALWLTLEICEKKESVNEDCSLRGSSIFDSPYGVKEGENIGKHVPLHGNLL